MAASISESVRAAFKTILDPLKPDTVLQVERAREDEYSARESPSINIKFDSEDSRVHGNSADNNQVGVNVEIYVRPGDAEVWETKADVIAVAAHALIMAYASWPAGVARVRKTGATPRSDQGDRTPGLLTLQYAVQFLSSAVALDKPPFQP